MSWAPRRDERETVRVSLVDADALCRHLGLAEGMRRQARGVMIRCPWHEDRTASCSVRALADGPLAVHCFACGAGGDVFTLIAAARGLEVRRDFRRILTLASEIARVPMKAEPITPMGTTKEATPSYPPAGEVAELWGAAGRVGDAQEVDRWLTSRALDVGVIEDLDLARALPSHRQLPRWARLQGKTWAETGHHLVIPVVDAGGVMRSLRARCVHDGDYPKSLPPAGYRVGGLVMADSGGRRLMAMGMIPDYLQGANSLRVVVAEGEPDYLTWATRFSDGDVTAPAILGVVSGSWTPGIAARIPSGARVVIRTHLDNPGERYAGEIHTSLRDRCIVLRGGVRRP